MGKKWEDELMGFRDRVLRDRVKKSGHSRDEAEDLADAAILKALEEDDVDNPLGFMIQVSRNDGETRRRKKKMQFKHQDRLAEYNARRLEVLSPLDELVQREEAEILEREMTKALASLREVEREVLEARVFNSSTTKELAKRFNLTDAAVKGLLQRAREKLRQYLKSRLYGRSSEGA
jgi:RNA polymerase sigma factor (sigma-70 family)